MSAGTFPSLPFLSALATRAAGRQRVRPRQLPRRKVLRGALSSCLPPSRKRSPPHAATCGDPCVGRGPPPAFRAGEAGCPGWWAPARAREAPALPTRRSSCLGPRAAPNLTRAASSLDRTVLPHPQVNLPRGGCHTPAAEAPRWGRRRGGGQSASSCGRRGAGVDVERPRLLTFSLLFLGGNQRELARQKNMKKQSDSVKGKRRDDGLSAAARKQR